MRAKGRAIHIKPPQIELPTPFSHMGYVQKALFFPCARPDPFLVIQAAGAALAPVLISAFTVGCRDIIKMRAGQSPWHTRGIRTMINNVISPSEADKYNKLFKYTIPLEKLFFVWFVADLTVEFIARFHSQAFRLGACGDFPEQCSWSGDHPSCVVPHPGAEVYASYARTSVSGPCLTSGGLEFAVPKGHYWQASFGLTMEAIGHGTPPSSVHTWLEKQTATNFNYPKRAHAPEWFGNKVHAINHYQRTEPEREFALYRFMASADQPCLATGGTCSVTTGPYPVMDDSIIPTNCLGAPAPYSLAGFVEGIPVP